MSDHFENNKIQGRHRHCLYVSHFNIIGFLNFAHHLAFSKEHKVSEIGPETILRWKGG